jgi:hypothetical protein
VDHDHDHRPAVQRAVLAAARSLLDGNRDAAHDTAEQAGWAGACPACTTVAGISFGIALASTLAGDQVLVSEPVRQAILAAITAAEGEMRASGN